MSLEGKREYLEMLEYGHDPTKRTINDVTYYGNHHVQVPWITVVEGNLWQGGCQGDLVLPEFIKHVVSLYPWEKYKVKHNLDSEVYVRMFDDAESPVDSELIRSLGAWVNVCRRRGSVLVNCQMGMNRSSLVVAEALKQNNPAITGDEIIKILRERRHPAVLCNPAFEEYVRSL